MADNDINITFSDGPQDDPNQANATSPLGEGFHKKKESQEELFNRLFSDLTDSMLDIFNLLSGNGNNDFMDNIRNAASAILGTQDTEEGEEAGNEKSGSFTKASKVDSLKPSDINIVDQQWILGSLLVNSTLLRIEDLIKNLKTGGSVQTVKAPSSSSGEDSGKGKGGLKKLREDVSDFNEINELAKVIIPVLMTNMQMVKWGLVFSFFKNLKKVFGVVKDIVEEFDEYKDSLTDFFEDSKQLIGGLLIITLGLSAIAIFTPLLVVGTIGAYILQLAIHPMLAVVDSIGNNKNLIKFESNASTLARGMLHTLAAITLLALMTPLLPFAIVSALLLTVTMLAVKLVLLVMPKPGNIAKGIVSALLLTVFFASLALAIFFVHTVGTDVKKTLLNMAVIGIVALTGAAIAMILGIPFVLGLVALGTVTALSLVVFFAAITLALKIVARTAQYADDALRALGSLSKKAAAEGSDGTPSREDVGIIGFFARLASPKFILCLLISSVTSGLLALVGFLLYAGSVMVERAFHVLVDIGNTYFPVGVSFNKTVVGSAIIGIANFAKYMSGKIDAEGNPVSGKAEPIIGLGTLLEIAPLVLFGVLLTLAAFTLKKGFQELGRIDKTIMKPAQDNVVQLGETLRIIQTNLAPSKEGGRQGLVNWVTEKILGEDVGNAIEWLTACLPLFSLMLYGWLLEKAASPIQRGIDAMGNIHPEKLTDDKIKAIGTAISGMMSPIKEFTSGFMDHSDRYGNIVDAICGLVSAFPSLIDVIIKLGDADMPKLNQGLAGFAYLLDQLIGTPDTRSLADKFKEFFSFGHYDSGNGATQGSLVKALQSVNDNGVKVNTKVFDQISQLMEKIAPIGDIVVSFAKADAAALDRGINGVKAIINAAIELTRSMDGDSSGEGGWGAVNRILEMSKNKSDAKVAANNPLFAIVDLFKQMGNIETFANNVTVFNSSMTSLSSTLEAMNTKRYTGFNTFKEAISSQALNNGIENINKLVSYTNKVELLANAFDNLGNSLQKIAEIDTSKLTQVIEETNASAVAVIEAQRKAEANTQGVAAASAVDEYVQSISDLLYAWELNGIKIRQSNQTVNTTEIRPRVNRATTAGAWE